LKGLKRVVELSPQMHHAHLVYSGEPLKFSNGIQAIRFDQLKGLADLG
jgi:hypothetical protein